MTPRIKITSDGTSAGTKILDAVTGEDLGKKYHVSHVEWSCYAQGMATAVLTFLNVAVDVTADNYELIHSMPPKKET